MKKLDKNLIPDAISILKSDDHHFFPFMFYDVDTLKSLFEVVFEAEVDAEDIKEYVLPYDPEVEDQILIYKHNT